jgi:uncharacterized protein with HEPN domain
MKDALYLDHILECIKRIEANTSAGRDNFLSSHLLQDATLRNLQIMAESTQRLSERSKALQPQIPWARIAGFRNVLTHGYLTIDFEIIWAIIQSNIPSLKQAILAIVNA